MPEIGLCDARNTVKGGALATSGRPEYGSDSCGKRDVQFQCELGVALSELQVEERFTPR